MLMRWIRQSFDLKQATTRLTNDKDLANVLRLLRDGARHYYGLAGEELPILLADAHAVVIETGNVLQAFAVVGFFVEYTSWLRVIALAKGLDIAPTTTMLLENLHATLRTRGLRHIFYSGDDAADSWLISLLRKNGYILDTEVIVYEKRTMTIPARGNQMVYIRPVEPSDLFDIIELDRICFEAHWTKDDATVNAAIHEKSFFIVAELGTRIVGYAHVTTHFGGRLLHLVRIAVDPLYRGQGVGIRLLSEVITFARSQQSHVITLNTQSYNKRAQQLYRWFGFVSTGERQPVMRYDL